MQVLILGGGSVGLSVAKRLSQRDCSVTIIERDTELTASLDNELDARLICGDVAFASALFQANAASADLCFALTGNDETNLIAASVAKKMGAHRVAARIYNPEYRDIKIFDYRRHFNIDILWSLEYLTAIEFSRRIRESGAMLIEHFACGELELQNVIITKDSSLTNKPLRDLHLSSETRIGAIARGNSVKIAGADDCIQLGDRITLLGARPQVEDLKKQLHTHSIKKQNVTIVGGGETGFHIASILEGRNYNVSLLERDRSRCLKLANQLLNTNIQCGDWRLRAFLEEHRVASADVFIACDGDDERNIVSCIEARELGAKKIMTVVDRPDYANIIGKLGIDVISPYDVIGRQLECMLHKGALVFQNSSLLGGSIEVAEFEVGENSLVTRRPLKDVCFPKPTLIAAIVRDNEVLMPNAMFEFRANDSVVVLTSTPLLMEVTQFFEAQ